MQSALPPRFQEILNRELSDDENVLWASVPDVRGFIRSSWQSMQVGAVFLAFVTFWMWNTVGECLERSHAGKPTGNSIVMILLGSFLALKALQALLAPLLESRKCSRTIYAITDRRALIIHALRTRIVHTFQGERLADYKRREDSSGSGDIVFAREAQQRAKGRNFYYDIGFIGLKDVRGAERKLRECHSMQRAARPE